MKLNSIVHERAGQNNMHISEPGKLLKKNLKYSKVSRVSVVNYQQTILYAKMILFEKIYIGGLFILHFISHVFL